jgi:hypothetical protein
MSAGIEFNANVLNQLGTPAMNSNLFANRPAAGFTGRIFISTDTREIYRDTGISWELIGSGGGSVNIYNSDGTLTGNRVVTLSTNTLTFRQNQNQGTSINLENVNGGNLASTRFNFNTDLGNGSGQIIKYGNATVPYKIIGAGTFAMYNGTSGGNLAFLNDHAAGSLLFSAGGSSTAQMTLTNLGRLLLGTTTDAGFLADFNGTSVFRNNMFVYAANGVRITSTTGDNNTGGWLYTIGGGGGSLSMAANIDQSNVIPNTGARSSRLTIRGGSLDFSMNDNPGSTGLNFGFNYFPVSTSTGGIQVLLNVNPLIFPNSGNATFDVLRLRPTYNFTGSYSGGPLIGFRYNPILTSLNGVSQHIAIQTDSGTVDHYDRLDLTTSNFSDRNIWTLHARLRQTLTPGADQAGAGYYVGGLHIREISASGNNTFGNATINAGGASSLQIDFTGAGTLTASQSGLRAFSGHQIFNTFGGSASGTITHFAGMQILGLYNRNSGVITPTITNAYGLIINNLNDYSHTFTLTNRWGLYQTGASDNNYLAGKLLVGTTTVTARQVHINGNIELTTTLAGTAGGSSGQHLSIWANGNEYKIALLNP